MSGYLHGGSALTIDIGARNGTHVGGAGSLAATALVPGDWVQISAQPNSDGSYEAILPTANTGAAAAAAQAVMPVGVVLGPPGMQYAAGSAADANDGSEFMVRIKGVVTAKVNVGVGVTAPAPLNRANAGVAALPTAATDFAGTAADAIDWAAYGCGVLLSDHGGTGVEFQQVFVTNK